MTNQAVEEREREHALTDAVLAEEKKFLRALQSHLHDDEQMLIAFVRRWAARSEGPQTTVRQLATKALVNVQSARARIDKISKPWEDIVPDSDGLFGRE